MRTLLFIDSLGAGGAQRQLVGLASILKEKGYDVSVLTYYDIPFYKGLLDKGGIQQEVVNGGGKYIGRIVSIKKAIDACSPDVVIAYLETPSIIACILKLLGAKWNLIVSERNTTQKNNWKESLRFNIFRIADYVVPNAYAQERFIRNHCPFLTNKTITIHNFVDTNRFSPAIGKRNGGKVKIVVAASIWASKNTLGFIRAVAILIQHTRNFHISWYGRVASEQAYLESCLALIEEYGLKEYIELLDKTQEIADRYREADIFCLPSFYEGTPNVICEAMASGLPIVCSDVCDNAIYVKEHVNGWLFDPTLPADIADKLKQAIAATPEQRNTYGNQSRVIAEKNLSIETFANKYVSLINQNLE